MPSSEDWYGDVRAANLGWWAMEGVGDRMAECSYSK